MRWICTYVLVYNSSLASRLNVPRPQELLPMSLLSCGFAEACFLGTRRRFMQSKWRWKESSTSAAAHPSPHWRPPPGNQWKILQFWVQKMQMPGNGRPDLLQLIHNGPFSESCTCLKTSQSEWEESQRLQAPSDWGWALQVLVPASPGSHMEQKQFGQCGRY